MSKSLGNVLDPFEVMDTFGTDALRFYCFREVSFGQDGGVSTITFGERYKTELANEYGNLASRTLSMIDRYRDGVVPEVDVDPALAADFDGLRRARSSELLDRAEITQALERIWQRVRRLNRYVEERAPWQLAKDESQGGGARPDAALAGRGPARGHRAAAPVHARDGGASCWPRSGAEDLVARARPVRRAARRQPRREARRRCSRSRSDRQPHPPRPRPGAEAEIVPAAREAGVTPHPHDRDRRSESRRAALAAADDLRRGLRRGRPPPQQRHRLRRRDHRGAARARPPTRAAWRSARPGSTTTATTRRAPTRSAPSAPRSSSRARSASRSSSTRARPRTTRSPRSPSTRAGLEVILHCFSMPDRLEECLDRGWWISFAGNVTYPKAERLAAAAERVPLDRLLVETDAPYLTPQPVRKHRNQPAYVVHTARFIAERRGIAYEELEAAVEANAARLLGLVSELPAQPSLRRLRAVRRPAQPRAGPELPDRLEHPRRDRPRRGARPRRRRARGRRRARRAVASTSPSAPRHVHVVELDRKLEPALRDALDPHPNATLHLADAVKLDLATLRPRADQGGRQPAVRRRGRRDPAHDRAAPAAPRRGWRWCRRRSASGSRRSPGRPPTACRPCSRSWRADVKVLRPISPHRLPPGAQRGLRARRPHPPRPRARSRRCARSCSRASRTAARRSPRSLALAAAGDRATACAPR